MNEKKKLFIIVIQCYINYYRRDKITYFPNDNLIITFFLPSKPNTKKTHIYNRFFSNLKER